MSWKKKTVSAVKKIKTKLEIEKNFGQIWSKIGQIGQISKKNNFYVRLCLILSFYRAIHYQN